MTRVAADRLARTAVEEADMMSMGGTNRQIVVAFLNAVLADDAAMERGRKVFTDHGLRAPRTLMRAAIEAAVSQTDGEGLR